MPRKPKTSKTRFRRKRTHRKRGTKKKSLVKYIKHQGDKGGPSVIHKEPILFNHQWMPERYRTVMHFGQKLLLYTTSTASYVQARFRINSPWDPNYASGTGQSSAYGHVTLGNVYKRYRVHGAKIIIKILGPYNDQSATYNGMNFRVALCPQTGNATPGSFDSWVANPRCITKDLDFITFTHSNKNPFVLEQYVDIADMIGSNKMVIEDDPAYSALIEANPTNVFLWSFCFQQMIGSIAGGQGLYYQVDVFYDTEYFDRADIALPNNTDYSGGTGYAGIGVTGGLPYNLGENGSFYASDAGATGFRQETRYGTYL